MEAGWVANAPRPSVIRVAPPLIVTEAEVDAFIAAFADALAATIEAATGAAGS